METYTYTRLPVSRAAYDEIAGKLGVAMNEGEYGRRLDKEQIDMHGLALVVEGAVAKFRQLPIEIEAYRWTKEDQEAPSVNSHYWPGWLFEAHLLPGDAPGACFRESLDSVREGRLFIHTDSGNLSVEVGDWIIRGVAGDLQPCKDDIFRLHYERV